jgi:nicotinate phosphoribosyltransferase
VVAGTGRLVELIRNFRFDAEEVDFLRRTGVVDNQAAEWLATTAPRARLKGPHEESLTFGEVEPRGLEPLTPALQRQCSAS